MDRQNMRTDSIKRPSKMYQKFLSIDKFYEQF